jgi:hypothetical protein
MKTISRKSSSFFVTVLTLLLVAMFMAMFLTTPVASADGPQGHAAKLTVADFANAITLNKNVRPEVAIPASGSAQKLYRSPDCSANEQDPNKVCYMSISGARSGAGAFKSPLFLSPSLIPTGTDICWFTGYNLLGMRLYELDQDTNVSWYGGGPGALPAVANWANLKGSGTFIAGWNMGNVSGPTVSPGLGIKTSALSVGSSATFSLVIAGITVQSKHVPLTYYNGHCH